MTPPASSPTAPAWRWFFVAVAFCLAFFTTVHLFLTPGASKPEPGIQVAPPPDQKLFVFIIDGMRPDDAKDPRLTFLQPFRDHGFFAEIQPCLECLTVPCISEAFTGTASAGLLGAYHNLVSASELSNSSLFSDVLASGRRTAVVHEGQYRGFSRWLTHEYRGKKEWETVQSWLSEGVELIVWHYPHLDEVAHHAKVGTKRYKKALDKVDADAKQLVAALPADYRLVVVGDHGHTATGRHIFGLDIPTAFLSDGTLFGTTPVDGRLPLSTYRYLLGAELGILPPHEYEGADLAARLPVGSAIRALADGRTYAGPLRDGVTPTWVVLTALCLATFAVWLLPSGLRNWGAVGMGLALVGGYAYLPLLPHIHYTPALPYLRERIIIGVLVIGGVGWLFRRSAHVFLIATLLTMLILPGTVYNYGVFQVLPHLLGATVALLTLPKRLKAGDRGVLLLPILIGVGVWYLLGAAHVGTFAISSFPRIKYYLPVGSLAAAWAGMAAAFAHGWKNRVMAAVIAGIGASGWIPIDGYPLAVVSAVILVVIVLFPRALSVVGAFAALPWYGDAWGVGVVAAVAFASVSAWLMRDDAPLRRWLLPLVSVGAGYLSLAMTGQLRTNGLDFDFAIDWLPGDLHLRLWPIVAAALILKVALAPILVVLGVQRFGGPVDGFAAGRAVYVRLAALSCAIAGLLVQTASPPRYRIFEQLEDMIAWIFVALVVVAMARRNPYLLPPLSEQSRG